MTQVIVQNVFKNKEKILSFFVFGIVACSFLYIYFLQNAISNVVAREKIVKDNRVLSTAVSELEAKYFTVKNSITIELAHSKGFKDSDNPSFISKDSVTAMVNTHGL